ncbi:MAG: hypothetical protein GY720_14480 [bacterium]|nr:hypothetical protein [bacterium]
MQVMGTNSWAFDVDPQMLITQALAFADMVREQGIAELHGAWIAEDEKLMWCTWDTNDLAALQTAFDEMNRQSGLTSALTSVKAFYSTVQETTPV